MDNADPKSNIADIEPKGTTKSFAKKGTVKLDRPFGEWKPYLPLFSDLLTGNIYRLNLDKLTLQDLRLMKDDYQISACLNVITFTIQQVNWRVKGSNAEIETFIDYALRRIWNNLIRTVSQAYWSGYSASVKVFTDDPISKKIIYKRIRDLAPETVKILQDKDDTFNGFKQSKKLGGEETIDPQYSFWYAFMMTNGNFYGEKLLKSAYIPWKFSQILHLYANRYYERFGEPTAIGRYPVGENVQDEDGNVKDAGDVMQEILDNWRSHSSLPLPSNRDESGNHKWAVDLLETNLYRGVDFESYLKRLDMEKARAIFNPDLLFGSGRVGSYNLGVEQKNTFLVMLNAFIEDLKPYINQFVIKPLVDLNFAPKKGKQPWAEFQYEEFGKVKSDHIVQLVLSLIKDGKISLDPTELGSHLGLTIEDVKELTDSDNDSEDKTNKDEKKEESNDKETASKEPLFVMPTYDRDINLISFLQFSRIKEQIEKSYKLQGEERKNSLKQIDLGFRGKFVDNWVERGLGDKEKADEKFEKVKDGLINIIDYAVENNSSENDLIPNLAKYFSSLSEIYDET